MELESEKAKKRIARENLEKAGYKLENLADKNCRRCYGRGYTALTQDNKRIMCKCAKKNLLKKPDVPPVRH